MLWNARRLTLVVLAALLLAGPLVSCGVYPRYTVDLVYDVNGDGNEVWVVHYTDKGEKVTELVTSDITPYVPGAPSNYAKIQVTLDQRHKPEDEPNVPYYYYFEYVTQQGGIGSHPVYYDRPAESAAFSVRANRLGSGWTILRETMFLFGPTSYPTSRFEQIYRGPDGKIYLYLQRTRDLTLLQDAINAGRDYYTMSEFE